MCAYLAVAGKQNLPLVAQISRLASSLSLAAVMFVEASVSSFVVIRDIDAANQSSVSLH
jgi:hypothetical protein